MRLAKAQLGWPYEEPFTVPPEALAHFREALERGRASEEAWSGQVAAYRRDHAEEAARWDEDISGRLPDGWSDALAGMFQPGDKPMATREASSRVMNAIAERVHAFTGGSADLAPSTKTILKDHSSYGFDDYCGHNIHFGVREHGMGAIANGWRCTAASSPTPPPF